MDKEQVRSIVQDYAKIVIKQMIVKAVILYGSYARGDNKKDSDIDVAVIVPKEAVSKNILEDMTKLCRLTRDVSLDIEPVLLIEGEDRSGFQEHIMSYGEVIYSQ
jgi:predicted nucleotidyltransferase